MSEQQYDIAIIGAGPAGMAAAATAASLGASVIVLDEQGAPGGRVYQGLSGPAEATSEIERTGKALISEFRASLINYRAGAMVWRIDPGFSLYFSVEGYSEKATAQKVIIATGAQERPAPFPGWTLPGVMNAGAGQILLKSAGLTPDSAVLAGSGPLLYLFASQLIKAGAPPKALIETPSPGWRVPLSTLKGAWRGRKLLARGRRMLSVIKKAGVPRYRDASNFAARESAGGLSFAFDHRGKRQSIECENVFIHQGVIPETTMTRAFGAKHHWSTQDRAWTPRVSVWGETTEFGLWAVGDGAGIDGAEAAALQGRLAALQACVSIDLINKKKRDDAAAPLLLALEEAKAPRPFLNAMFHPPVDLPPDDTIVCRCECVTAGQVREAARLEVAGHRQIKAFARTGMGPCQGRFCASVVGALISDETGRARPDIRPSVARAPYKPVPLGELAKFKE
ncbi:MAG: NAD(P)/FAD-dependent oxidoreductase [Pikeienuella sp.]